MSEIPLPGLRATEPTGFLAALGLLRVLAARAAFAGCKLAWAKDAHASAVLHTQGNIDDVIQELLLHLNGRDSFAAFAGLDPGGSPVGGAVWDDLKVDPDLFAAWLLATRPASSPGGRESADFLSAFASELVVAASTKDLKPTAFHMTSARQKFLVSCRRLAGSLGPSAKGKKLLPPEAAIREALLGPWRGADEFSALGLDPEAEAIYALAASKPGDEAALSTRAAVWLVIESLPLFPVAPARGRLQTRGFAGRPTTFRWPVWDGALSIDAVRTAVGLDWADDDSRAERLDALGVRFVMASERITFGQGYGQLRPAARLA